MSKPNFFIIGFPKCGTTALASYLARHPDISFSRQKEPHFFATDFCPDGVRSITDEEDYLRQFSGYDRICRAVGEASTGYVFSEIALNNILTYADDPKFIVMIRDPVDMVVSLHAQMLKKSLEDVEEFEEAWRLSPLRKQGRSLPKNAKDIYLTTYQDFGRVGTRLEKAIELVGSDRLKIIVLDDMASDPRSVYVGVLDFLGLGDDGQADFLIENERRYHRFGAVGHFTNSPPQSLVALGNMSKRLLGFDRIGLLGRLREWNLSKQERGIGNHVLMEMQEHYKEEVRIVERLLGRELDWMRGPDGAESHQCLG